MDFTFKDLFEKKNLEALDTCVFVVISTAIRQLPINIFISGIMDHLVFTVYISKLEYTSILGSWVIVSGYQALGYRLLDLISSFFLLWVSVDCTALNIGIRGCTLVSPLHFPSDETKVNCAN